MAMSSGGGAAGVQSTPNVTPMVDVMLVLLIIFMVVAPALLAGFNAEPPQAQNIKDHPEDDQTDQVLGIDKDYGTLAKSKMADLLVLEKNPLDDIANTKTLRTVYIGGKRFE